VESTRNKLIRILSNNMDHYISGQALSEKLHISRTAIWKHMNELKKDGYEIEGVSNKGYRIIRGPDKLSENTIRWGLQTDWLGKNIIHEERASSTQTIAHRAAQETAEHGTVVIADEQIKGKGRMSRTWHSAKGKGMWISIILRPKIPPYRAPQLTLLTAVVLANVINKKVHPNVSIKWPNDILMNGKKAAGILTEMQAEQDQIQYIVVGIGLNINQTIQDFPEDVLKKATSLKIETGKDVSINKLVKEFLTQFETAYEEYLKEGFSSVKARWESFGFRIGEMISIQTPKTRKRATFFGIGEDGELLIQSEDGQIEKLYSGEIDWFEGMES